MRVIAKRAGEIEHQTPDGTFHGVRFAKGDRLTIPDAKFRPDLFASLEPKKAEKKADEKKADAPK